MYAFFWNPDPSAFTIPFTHHPVRWYGVCYSLGFLVMFFFYCRAYTLLLSREGFSSGESGRRANKLALQTLYVAVGTVFVSARLAHVFFYQWAYYRAHPWDILKIWEGGLDSHGAVVGFTIAFYLLARHFRPQYPWCTLFAIGDLLTVPMSFLFGLVRIGNFINQEKTGTATTLPWGVAFAHPKDGPAGVPLHPVQLYEALAYFLIAGGLFFYWRKNQRRVGSGLLSAYFFIFVFGIRFFLEFLKNPQTSYDLHTFLNRGQLLSIPCILLGFYLVYRARRKIEKIAVKGVE